jgi:hypothetical protein
VGSMYYLDGSNLRVDGVRLSRVAFFLHMIFTLGKIVDIGALDSW